MWARAARGLMRPSDWGVSWVDGRGQREEDSVSPRIPSRAY